MYIVYEVKPHHNTIHILILPYIVAFQSIRNIIHFFLFFFIFRFILIFKRIFVKEEFCFTWKYFYEHCVFVSRDSQSNEQINKKTIITQTSNFQCFLQFFCILKGKLKNSFIYIRSYGVSFVFY